MNPTRLIDTELYQDLLDAHNTESFFLLLEVNLHRTQSVLAAGSDGLVVVKNTNTSDYLATVLERNTLEAEVVELRAINKKYLDELNELRGTKTPE